MHLPWLSGLDDDLRKVFQHAGVPSLETQAFDGDGWVWSGRGYLDRPTDGESARVAEVQFRARPDQLHDGPQVELVAAAWGLKGRRVSWSRTCWARYVDPNELHADAFIEELATALKAAWQDAQTAAGSLGQSSDPRDEAISMLQERGVPLRAHRVDFSAPAVAGQVAARY